MHVYSFDRYRIVCVNVIVAATFLIFPLLVTAQKETKVIGSSVLTNKEKANLDKGIQSLLEARYGRQFYYVDKLPFDAPVPFVRIARKDSLLYRGALDQLNDTLKVSRILRNRNRSLQLQLDLARDSLRRLRNKEYPPTSSGTPTPKDSIGSRPAGGSIQNRSDTLFSNGAFYADSVLHTTIDRLIKRTTTLETGLAITTFLLLLFFGTATILAARDGYSQFSGLGWKRDRQDYLCQVLSVEEHVVLVYLADDQTEEIIDIKTLDKLPLEGVLKNGFEGVTFRMRVIGRKGQKIYRFLKARNRDADDFARIMNKYKERVDKADQKLDKSMDDE